MDVYTDWATVEIESGEIQGDVCGRSFCVQGSLFEF